VHLFQLVAENMSLIENASGSGDNKNQRQVLSKTLSAILAFFFGAISLTLTAYGVYQSREISGWAALMVIAGDPFFWAAPVLFLDGMLGWGGLGTWGL